MSSTQTAIQQLIVIDLQVDGWQTLVENVGDRTAVLALHEQADGLTQLCNYLESLPGPLNSIHVVSHGSPASISIGSTQLGLANLQSYRSQLADIGSKLAPSGEILLYGCNVARGVLGGEFIRSLARLTGANVAASDTLTGSAALGGDWLLAQRTGPITSALALDAQGMANYAGVLDAADFGAVEINEILAQFGDIDSFLKRYLGAAETIPGFTNLVKAATGGFMNFDAAGASVVQKEAGAPFVITFTLPDSSQLAFIVGSDILDKIAHGQTDFLLAVDYVANPNQFSSLFKNTPFEGLTPSQTEIVLSTQAVDTLLGVAADSGVSLIAQFDISGSNAAAFKFAHDYLGITALDVIVNVDKSHQTFSAEISLDKKVTVVSDFSVTFNNFAMSVGFQSATPELTVTQSITLRGYDPTQLKEPDLVITTGAVIDPSAVTVFGEIKSDYLLGWSNPFGFQGATINLLVVQAGLTYIPPFIDNVGVVVDLEWSVPGTVYDIQLALAVDINTPGNNAFALTINKEINLVALVTQMNPLMIGVNALSLLTSSKSIFDYIPLTIMSSDSDGDGHLDPLLSVVPVETTIGTFVLAPGLNLNAQVNLAGVHGELTLHASTDYTEMSGSLKIEHVEIADVLTISGVNKGEDFESSFEFGANGSHFEGDGKIALFGLTMAQAHFEMTDSIVKVTETFVDLGLFKLSIISLDVNVDPLHFHASGSGTFSLLGQTLGSTAFDINSSLVSFNTKLGFGPIVLEGDFNLSIKDHTLDAKVTRMVGNLDFGSGDVHVDSNGNFQLKTTLHLGNIPGIGPTIDATATANYSGGKVRMTIDTTVLGNNINFDVAVDGASLASIKNTIEAELKDDLGAIPEYIGHAIVDGVGTIYDIGSKTFSAANVKNIASSITDTFNKWFGTGSGETNKTFIGGNGNDSFDANGGKDTFFGNGGNDWANGHQASDLLDGGAGNDTLYGGSGNDILYGGDGNDYLSGQEDSDKIYGGAGKDLIYGDGPGGQYGSGDDEAHGGLGDDRIEGGPGNDALFGDGGNDSLFGEAGNDNLNGGSGDDWLSAGIGNDNLTGGDGNDILWGEDGVDTLHGNNGNDRLFGGNGDDTLYGDAGNDVLDGQGGNDVMYGGAGNDVYYVDSVSDLTYDNQIRKNLEINPFKPAKYVVTDQPDDGGIDTVYASVSYGLGKNIENLRLTGTNMLVGTGNELNNEIYANAAGNALYGGAGNDHLKGGSGIDLLDGGLGDDTLSGGSGDDNYFVDSSADVVIEGAGGGTDKVNSSASFILLDNVENLTLTGTAAINGTGNALKNTLIGNSASNTLAGGAGDDVLKGGTGDDTLEGGSGSDTFVFDGRGADNGIDAITDFGIGDSLSIGLASFDSASFVSQSSSLANNQIHVSSANGVTLVKVGTNAAAGADLTIQLTGTYAASDFTASGSKITLKPGAGNSAPAGADSTITLLEDGNYVLKSADFGFTDSADALPNQFKAILVSSLPAAGHLALAGAAVTEGQTVSVIDINAGKLQFTPAPDGAGIAYASFGFRVQDDGGTAIGGVDTDPTPSQLTVDVTAVNDAPTVATSAVLPDGTEDTPYTVSASDLLAGMLDIDGDALSVISLRSDKGVVLDNQDGSFTFTPLNNFNGRAALSYTVSDGHGGLTEATASYTTTPVDDASVVVAVDVTVSETNAPLTVKGVLSISDIDSAPSFEAQPNTGGQYGVFTLGVDGAWSYTAKLAYDNLNPGDSLTDTFAVYAADGSMSSVKLSIAGTAETSTVRLGDAPTNQSGKGGQWLQAWSQTGYGYLHKADYTNALETWSAVKLTGVSSQLFSGGDIYAGDLGVSGQSAATTTVKQEIDGKEALRVTLPGAASTVTVKLANFFLSDDGGLFNESGLLRLIDADGQVVGEQAFFADAASGAKSVTLSANAGFTAIELLAGAYDANSVFVHGAYSDAAGLFGSAIAADAAGKLHGSDFLLDSVQFEVLQLVGVA